MTRAKGRCETRGLLFNDERIPGHGIHPNRMSLDRMSAKRPYPLENGHLVRAIVNISRNDQTLTTYHMARLAYIASLGGFVPDALVLYRDDNIEKWRFSCMRPGMWPVTGVAETMAQSGRLSFLRAAGSR